MLNHILNIRRVTLGCFKCTDSKAYSCEQESHYSNGECDPAAWWCVALFWLRSAILQIYPWDAMVRTSHQWPASALRFETGGQLEWDECLRECGWLALVTDFSLRLPAFPFPAVNGKYRVEKLEGYMGDLRKTGQSRPNCDNTPKNGDATGHAWYEYDRDNGTSTACQDSQCHSL